MPYTNAKSGSVPQQKFRFLTVAARFPVHDEVSTNARKPSRDRKGAEQFYWHCVSAPPTIPRSPFPLKALQLNSWHQALLPNKQIAQPIKTCSPYCYPVSPLASCYWLIYSE